MSDKGEKTCPLCAEEMDLTDQQLKPCKCGYEICVWCWHHIMEMAEKDNTEGRCPACRSIYDKEKIVGMAANCERLVAEINSERKQKPQKAKPKASEGRMHLSNVRVIKRNLVYIIGLPLDLADEDLLQRREYFGQYGKVLKVSISKTANGVIQHSSNNSCCVYVTYSKEEEAVCCIQSVHSFVLDGRSLRACFGTTKYCHAWLRNVPCNIPDCLYLHDYGSQEDSFTKDEIVSAFSRSKVQQTIGASNNLHRRSGNVLPPPLTECISSSISSSAKPVAKSHLDNIGNESRESCVDGGSQNSTVLPAAASWVMRVSASLSPVPNMSASCRVPNNKPDANAGPNISSEVASTKRLAHDVRRIVTAEESSETQSNYRTDSLEFSKDSLDGDYRTCTSNRIVDTLSNTTSVPVTCREPDTSASKIMGIAAPINIESSYCCKSSYTSGSDDENFNAGGDFQGLSSICNLSQTKNEEPVPVLESSIRTRTSFSLPRGPSLQEDMSEQNFHDLSLPVESKPMTTKDLLDIDDQRLKSLEDICNLPSSSCSISLQQNSNKSSYNPWQEVKTKHQNELLSHSRILPVHDKVSFPLTHENLVSSNGFQNDMDGCFADWDRSFDCSSMLKSGNGKGINNAASVQNYTTPDVGEDCLISKVLSMELDPWEDSLTSPDSLSKLFRETKEQCASVKPPTLRKLTDNNQSRFSFARQEGFCNQASDLGDSLGSVMDLKKCSTHHDINAINDLCIDRYRSPFSLNFSESDNLLNNHTFVSSKLSVSKPRASIPPGFSAPSRAPPPGFSTSGRMHLGLDGAATHLPQASEPQIKSTGNSGDVEIIDPAILEVGQGLMAMGLNRSGFDTWSSASHHSSFDHKPGFDTRTSAAHHRSFDHDARLQMRMQQSLYANQNLAFQDHSRNRLCQSDGAYSMSTTLLDQSPAYNPFSFPQSTIQQFRNAPMSNAHGGSWNEGRSFNDLRLPELLKNGGLGLNTLTPTYEDLKCQVSSSSNLYNRGFAM